MGCFEKKLSAAVGALKFIVVGCGLGWWILSRHELVLEFGDFFIDRVSHDSVNIIMNQVKFIMNYTLNALKFSISQEVRGSFKENR